MKCLSLLIFALVLSACDDGGTAMRPRSPRQTVAEFKSILPLRANQQTLLVMSNGKLYYHQPDATPELGLQMIDSTGQMFSTQLTPQRVAELLDQPFDRPVLRAITALNDGRLLAYFNGTSRLKSMACLVLFDPVSNAIRLVASPQELAEVSQMGLTLDLASAQIQRAGTTIWLCLTHSDQSVFLRLDARAVAAGSARLARAFQSLKSEGLIFRPASTDQLVALEDETLWLFRPRTGEQWRISTDGDAFPSVMIEDRPIRTVVPLVLPVSGSTARTTHVQFYPMPQLSRLPDQPPTFTTDDTRYPVLTYQKDAETITIDRERMIIRAAFPVYALRLTRWVADTATGDVIAYDAMSGEVFRIIRKLQ